MVNTVIRWAVSLVMVIVLCFAFYEIGKKQAKIEVVEKQVEVIRYVEKQKSLIQARPNVGRSDLLELMRAGKL